MPDFSNALISFGELIGLLAGPGQNKGSVQFSWFLDPLQNALLAIPDNRAAFAALMQALLDRTNGAADFDADHAWEPFEFGGVSAGLLWNKNAADDFRLGLGADANLGSGKTAVDLNLIARILKFAQTGGISHELGKFKFSGTIPVPDFLNGASLDGEIDRDKPKPIDINLKVKNTDNVEKAFPIPSDAMQWDAIRLVLFVLRAWIHVKAQEQAMGAGAGGGGGQAQDAGGFFQRVDNHLFPMLSSPPQIQSFPFIDDPVGTDPNFNNWKDSVLSTNAGAAGALTFLWHLRALVTGNVSPNLFSGSFYFPLVADSGPNGTPIPGTDFFTKGDYATTSFGKAIFFGVTPDNPQNPTKQQFVIDFHNDPQPRLRIVLAESNGDLSRPMLPAVDLSALLQFNGFSLGPDTVSVAGNASEATVSLLKKHVDEEPFDGDYALDLFLKTGAAPAYKLTSPFGSLTIGPELTPGDAANVFLGLVNFVLGTVAIDPTTDTGELIQQLVSFAGTAISGQTPDAKQLINAVLGLVGDEALGKIDGSPFTLDINPDGSITPTLSIGPINPGQLGNNPVHIGRFEAGATLTIPGLNDNGLSITELKFGIYDLRFGEGAGTGGGGTGLVNSLLPDLRNSKGFTFIGTYNLVTGDFEFVGGGKIPLQETIGPLSLNGLLVDLRRESLSVGLDLSFQLAVIKVSAYELGVMFPFESGDDGVPVPFLHGLGLSMDTSLVKLAGMFAAVKIEGKEEPDYVGGAVVSVAEMFELSAIGGYTKVDGEASLFIFASLVAPLGGPPWFFITGIAGGFGYNRTLPPPGLLTQHPFIKVMCGELEIGADAAAGLAQLSQYFAPVPGQFWVAAGIQFNSFGFINGKLVIAVEFGKKFSVSVLGLASFGIESIAYFELGIEASGNDEVFKLKAGLSKNSYIIHPDIFSLYGDFGLGIWHAGEHAGDFMLSIGGYHPVFKKPDHYDDLSRVGVKCVVYGFVRMTVECFFACTPQAIMAGASCSLAAEFAGIGAGLDVYLDVFIKWDPFFMLARMGVCVWFEFMGRHEIGVDLQIWTPPFGGIATIDLLLVSFDVEFGSSLADQPKLKLYEFLTRQVGVPATLSNSKALCSAFNTDDGAGLFRVDFTKGRTTKPNEDSGVQEGVATPIPMRAEFDFTVKTRLPLADVSNISQGLSGTAHIPLCGLLDKSSDFTITVTGTKPPTSPVIGNALCDQYPAAMFGEKPAVEAQADGAKQMIGNVDTKEAVVSRADTFPVSCRANLGVNPPALTGGQLEESNGEEEYPLPLGWTGGGQQPYRYTKSGLVLKASAPAYTLKTGSQITRRELAGQTMKNRTVPPLVVTYQVGDLVRHRVNVRLKGMTLNTIPADAQLISIPASPARRPEMLPVTLRVAPPHAPIQLRKKRLIRVTSAPNLRKGVLTPRDGATGAWKSAVSVPQGKTVLVNLQGGGSRIASQKLTFTGSQMVRAVFLGGGNDVLGDSWIAGSRAIAAPAGARTVALIGEGMYPPVSTPAGLAGPSLTAVANENIGVEHDSTLLAIAPRVFAGHGCIVECNTRMKFTAKPLDSVPGFKVLRAFSNFTLHFPAVPKGASLVLMVAPIAPDAGLATDHVRWASLDGLVGGLTTIVGHDSTALIMTVDAAKPWRLEVDLGPKWRLNGAIVTMRSARDNVNALRSRLDVDLIDDRMETSPETVSTSVAMEVA